MCASHVTWIKLTAACFQNSFSNFVQDEHDNVIEVCFCVAVPAVVMLRNNFLPRTAKHH
jgi:hypothetical protein